MQATRARRTPAGAGISIHHMGSLAPVLAIRGRDPETALLQQTLDQIGSGRRAIVLIEGEPGIGKTRLLEAALRDARGRGMQAAMGRAQELEWTRPFGVLASAFGCARSAPDPRRADIAELLATGRNADRDPITVTSDPGLRFRVVDALADLVEELAVSGPLVIGLDDVQWADTSSLLTLSTLARRIEHLPVGLIACFRLSPRSPELDRLTTSLAAAGARHLSLGGLDARAVTELVAEAVAAVPGHGLLAGISGAAGNPLFVTEMLGALTQEGMIETSGGRADVAQVILPPTLRLTILRRLSFLPDETLHVLRAASVQGSRFTVTDLSVTMGRPALELFEVLAEAITGRVLEEDGDRLRFRHDLIRDAIYEDLPAAVRRALHREAGQRLAQAGAPSLQVAEHLTRGAGPGDAEAISWLTRAAREAAARSPDVAADLMGRAAELTPATDQGRDRLLAEQAGSLMLAGGVPDALAACRQLLGRHHDPGVDGPVRICLGHALLARGQVRDALHELERAGRSPGAEQGAAQAWAGFARIALGDLDGAAALAEQARAAAASAADHLTTSIAMSTVARISESRGHLAEALQTAEEAVRLANASPGRLGHRFPVSVTRGRILIELDRPQDARSALGTGMRICQELGVRWALATHQVYLAYGRFTAGDWDDAIAELEAAVRIAEEVGEIYSLVYAHGLLSRICLHRGDLGRARESAAAADQTLAGWGAGHSLTWVAWPRALILEAGGEPGQALVTMTSLWNWCVSSGVVLEYPAIGADLVRLALTAGERGRARQVSAAVAEVAAGNDVAWMSGEALRCQGLIEDDAEVLQAAAAAHARGSRPLRLALACEDAGSALTRHGHAERARPLLNQALGIYERLGATRDLARAEATLREAGIRRGRRGTRSRPKFGWPSLTPTEHSVAGLVAEGLSNPQIGQRLFISGRTAQTHLAHIFAKLDISSRAQLAAEVARRHELDQ